MAKRNMTLRGSQEAFKTIVDTSLEGIYQVDSSGKFIFVNESLANLFGYRQEELPGKHFADMLSAETLPKVEKMVQEVLSGKNVRDEVAVKHKDGHEIPVSFSAAPLREQGAIIGLTGVLSDISERKQAEEVLREAHDQLGMRVKERTLELEKANEALQVEMGEHRRAEEAAKGITREFLTILENSVDMIYRLNLQSGTYDYLSPSSEIVLGYTPEEFIASGFENASTLVHPDDLEMLSQNILELIERAPEQTATGPIEYRMNHKQLGYRWVSDNRSIIYDDRNMPVAAIGILRDVTERKQAEQALQESERNYRVLFDSQIDGAAVVDAEMMKIVLVNETALKMYGFDSLEEALEVNLIDYIHPDDRDRILRIITEDMFEKDLRQVVEFRIITKDGRERWASAVGTRIEYQGKMAGLASFRDITEQKQAEEALQESEIKFREMADLLPQTVLEIDKTGTLAFLNRMGFESSGYSQADFDKGLNSFKLLVPEDRERGKENLQLILNGEESIGTEYTALRKDGTTFPVILYSSPIIRDKQPVGIRAVAVDITERKQAEEELRKREEYFRALIENSLDVVTILNADGTIRYQSPSLERILGYKEGEQIGESGFERLHPDDLTKVAEHFAELIKNPDYIVRTEIRYPHKDGSWHVIEATGQNLLDNPAVAGIVCNFRDITERKQAEEALRESEEKYRQVVELAHEGIAIVQDKIIKYVNPHYAEMLGYAPDEMIGIPMTNHISTDEISRGVEYYERRMAGEQFESESEIVLLHKDGSSVDVEVNAGLVIYEGKPADLAMIRDITERKQAEEKLRISEHKFKDLTETTPDWVWEIDENGVYTYVSPNVEQLLGYKVNEVLGKTPFNLMPREEAEKIGKIFEDLVTKRDPIHRLENINRHRDGHLVVLETNGIPFYDEEGVFKGYRGTDRDITERKRAEEDLRKKEEHFKALIENSTEAIAIIDGEGAIQYLGPSFERLMGYELEEYLGKNPFDHVHSDDRSRVAAIFAELMQKPGATVQEEVRVLHKNGSLRTVEVVGQNLLHNPAVGGIVANMRDITERKQAAEKLQALYQQEKDLREQIEKEMKRRVEFTRVLAHELKTPLTSVLASSDLLISEVRDEPLLSLAKNIRQGASNLNSRIDELLDLARGEVGMLQLKREPVDLSHLLREAADSMTPLALGRGQSIILRLPPALPTVQADTTRLQQVVTNLLNNAVKFTPKGGSITLRARKKDASVIVEVQDTGRGIPKREQERLFEPYQRLEEAEENLSGLGLGLSLCKTLVELHGGQIWMRSHVGRGSTFGFSLPLEAADKQTTEPEKIAKLWKVLIIEDDQQIVDSVSLTFRLRWPEVQLISTGLGEEGIEMAETEAPDIVILDLGLPDISGFDVLRQIRLFSSVPVVILTVREDESDMVKGLEWGADDYLVKPFKQLELLARLKVQLRKQTPPDEEAPIVCGPLRLEPSTFQLTHGGKEISLTIIEGRIIECLMRNAGHVVTHSRLAETVWGEDYPRALDSLRVYIRYLREKIEANPSKPKIILTKAGVGYSLVKPV